MSRVGRKNIFLVCDDKRRSQKKPLNSFFTSMIAKYNVFDNFCFVFSNDLEVRLKWPNDIYYKNQVSFIFTFLFVFSKSLIIRKNLK